MARAGHVSIVSSGGQRELRQDGATSEADDRPLEVRITELLALGPRTKNAIAATLKRSHRAIDDAITNLFAARSITTTEVTISGRPRKAFELRSEHPTEHPTR